MGFRKSVLFIILTQLLVGAITALFLCYDKGHAGNPKLYKEIDSQEPLIPNQKHNFDSYGGTDSITHSLVVNEPISITPQLKERKFFYSNPTPPPPHQTQTNTPILSIA